MISWLSGKDYGYLFWPGTHWTTWGIYDNIQYILTGTYAIAFDVSQANFDHLGLISNPLPVEEALLAENNVVTDLPAASVSYSGVVDGVESAATGFLGSNGQSKNPSQIIDMGRFMQRVEIPQITYANGALSGSVQIAAMTRHFVLTHRVSSSSDVSTLVARIKLEGNAISQYGLSTQLEGSRAVSIHNEAGEGWSFIIPVQDGVTSAITRNEDGSLMAEASLSSVQSGQELSLSLIAVPTTSGGDEQLSVWLNPGATVDVKYAQLNRDGSEAGALTQASWDRERGAYLVHIGDLTNVGAPKWPNWDDPQYHNWYNRHRLVITNSNTDKVSIPLAFDGGNNAAFYIVGGSPLFRDNNSEPIGAPMQISKNWHETPFWYHLYTALEIPTGSRELEHTFAHSKWGEAYAAAHAQLSLIGWSDKNQQWDESSLGVFGESVTYDPDLTLSRAQVDDVRPFLVQADRKWHWTGNVGGASFLVYASSSGRQSQPDHQVTQKRTHYAYTGPNLAHVMYAGKTRDGKITEKISTQLGRTDDLVRVYYHLTYTFLEDVSYNRLAFFQVAADRYADNGFTRYAYGNETGVTMDQEITNHGTTGYASEEDRGIKIPGNAPWVMLYASTRDGDALPEHLANIGFVVRAYEANLGNEIITTPHINLRRTYNGGYSQIGFELGLPYDAQARTVPAGSTVTATVEYLVPPAEKDAYYGASDYLASLDAGSYKNTTMMQTLAEGNQLTLTTAVGTIVRAHPPELQAAPGQVAAEFTLTGGLGYIPIIIHNLAKPNGWQLQQEVSGSWEEVNQAVEGKDYWQAYSDADDGSFTLIYNVHNRGTNTYRLSETTD